MSEVVADAELAAYGPLELLPWEFARLTPAEMGKLLDGWRWRDRRGREVIAWTVHALICACGWIKKPPKYEEVVAALLGREDAALVVRARAKKKRAP